MRSTHPGLVIVVVMLVAVLTGATLVAGQPTASAYRPVGTARELELAGFAKVFCSAVFISGRDPAEAVKHSGDVLMPSGRDKVTWQIDREQNVARVTLDGVSREARFYGDQGCIIQHRDRPGIFFTPVPVRSTLPDDASQPRPMGDRLPPEEPLPREIKRAWLDAAVEAAFDPAGLTAAFVVVYKARLVAERYMLGISKDTLLESWSMGKSITATLFGLLVKDGTYTLEQPAPVPAWREPGDPRGKIRNIDLLRMSSGLRFIAPRDPDYSADKGYPDHLYIYTGAIDAFEYSINQPVQFAAGTTGRYRNCDPLAIGYLIKQASRKRARTTSPGRNGHSSIGSESAGSCSSLIPTATSCSRAMTTARPGIGRGWVCSTCRTECGRGALPSQQWSTIQQRSPSKVRRNRYKRVVGRQRSASRYAEPVRRHRSSARLGCSGASSH
jgi:hypothetical protein